MLWLSRGSKESDTYCYLGGLNHREEKLLEFGNRVREATKGVLGGGGGQIVGFSCPVCLVESKVKLPLPWLQLVQPIFIPVFVHYYTVLYSLKQTSICQAKF